MNAVMGTQALMNCTFETACRNPPRRRAPLAARVLALALAFAGGVLAVSGEHWLLQEAPATANELTLATCALDDVYGAARPAGTCVSPDQQHAQGHTL